MTTKFAIVGTQRTGTTLIRTALDSHPQIRCIGEALNIGPPFYKRVFYKQNSNRLPVEMGYISYRRYIRSSYKRRFLHYFNRTQLVFDYLDKLYSLPGFSAVGFKFMYSQNKPFPMVQPYFIKDQVKIIHVVRNNPLKTVISRESKKVNKFAHSKSQIHVKKFYIKTTNLINTLNRICKENKYWDKAFDNYPSYIKVSYESYLKNKASEERRMLSFLEVNQQADLTSSLVKINPDKIEDIIENYDEVFKCLYNSPYEWCLH